MQSLLSACSLLVPFYIEWILTTRLCQLCAAWWPARLTVCCPVGMRYAAQSVEISLDLCFVLCFGHEMSFLVVLPSLVSFCAAFWSYRSRNVLLGCKLNPRHLYTDTAAVVMPCINVGLVKPLKNLRVSSTVVLPWAASITSTREVFCYWRWASGHLNCLDCLEPVLCAVVQSSVSSFVWLRCGGGKIRLNFLLLLVVRWSHLC